MANGRILSASAAMLLAILISSCGHRDRDEAESRLFEQARQNGVMAHEGLSRSLRYVKAWLAHADPETGLIPRNLDLRVFAEEYMNGGKDIWNAKDCAADNYSFMVLTASLTDRPLFEGRMLDMLKTEARLTSRVGRMPDTYVFSKKGFMTDQPDLGSIIFGSSEYIKDGLLPLTEWLGPSPWSERLIGILDDIWKLAPVNTPGGKIVSDSFEVNGAMLQTLSRVYWMTRDRKYLEWGVRLGDYHLLGSRHPTRDTSRLVLRDHGCEIVTGLCELYATVSFAMPAKQKEYREPIHAMLDRILEVGRNRHGLLYDAVNPKTGEHTEGLADTWGYTYNAFYTVYMVDRTEAYREATLKALSSLNDAYRHYRWEGDSMDGYADSIESAIYLYNREPVATVADWIDSEIKVMWSRQKDDGMIEGWHCDGNFARTSILYSLWKTQGVTVRPWSEDVAVGAVQAEGGLWMTITAKKSWSGRLFFDRPRHRIVMGLPMDWPRVNQLPEWFVVDAARRYTLTGNLPSPPRQYTGQQLGEGIELALTAGETRRLHVRPQAADGR